MLQELPKEKTLYRALVDRDSAFEGIFWAGIKTTGIFCRPTCSAKKPRAENVEFFPDVQQALLAGYRPCKRCRPLEAAGAPSEIVTRLLKALEERSDHRWKAEDLRQMGIDPATARRHFQNHFGMTFSAFARAMRLGQGFKAIREGAPVIEAQLDAGFESGSGFRDAFSRTMGRAPVKGRDGLILYSAWIETPLGAMLAIADDRALVLLEFADRRGLEKELERLRKKCAAAILPGDNKTLRMIRNDLKAYFHGVSLDFQTPVKTLGSPFQEKVWKALREIPAGETCSYKQIAERIGAPNSHRAVARANGTNQLALIIPCHRVIRDNGALSGYGGGVWRKKWLIDHEARKAPARG